MPEKPKWKQLKEWFKGLLDRNSIVFDSKLLIFGLSFMAASLLRITNKLSEPAVALIFSILVAILLLLLWLLARKPESESWRYTAQNLLQSRWGVFGIATLGFGLGALVYHYRAWLIWLWYQFRRINRPDEWVLVSLFLLGIMLGFFIVRNWAKDQKDFMASLTAVFGAAFMSTVLGQLNDQPGSVLTPQNAFAYYLLGFTLSGAINLIVFSMVAARYASTQSPTSRSVIDFLYGSDKAQAIDLYFLKNFEADPNYAKAKLVASLSEFREGVRRGLARQMNRRKKDSERDELVTSPPSPPGAVPAPLDYFELVSVGIVQQQGDTQVSSPPSSPPEAPSAYEIVFRKLSKTEGGSPGVPITHNMFRVSVSLRWLDNLEYIVATGEYRKSFPYYGSVAGMSLLVRRTIVMNRDKYKKFRTGDYVEGKSPSQADQPRGLYEIDYLSYICVPMASSLGKPEEESLGVLHVDTKLFACPKGQLPPGSDRQPDAGPNQEIYKIVVLVQEGEKPEDKLREKLKEFEAYACNLYLQNDPIIEYLEGLRGVIVPLLELYKKCRTGALNEAKTST